MKFMPQAIDFKQYCLLGTLNAIGIPSDDEVKNKTVKDLRAKPLRGGSVS
jgi:hypothetical protein